MLPFPKGCQLLPPLVLQIMEGHRFCGVEDEPRGEVTFSRQLSHCIVLLQFVPIVPFQLQKLSDAMYLEDKEEGMAVFREVFDFLKMPREDPDNPEKVRSVILDFLYCSLYLSIR